MYNEILNLLLSVEQKIIGLVRIIIELVAHATEKTEFNLMS